MPEFFRQVTFDFSTVERQEEETDSPSFPVPRLGYVEPVFVMFLPCSLRLLQHGN